MPYNRNEAEAKLDPEVEGFLLKAKFPYAIGYGLTETSPLLGYAMNDWRGVGVMGYPVYNVQMKLHNINPETGEGERILYAPRVYLQKTDGSEQATLPFRMRKAASTSRVATAT